MKLLDTTYKFETKIGLLTAVVQKDEWGWFTQVLLPSGSGFVFPHRSVNQPLRDEVENHVLSVESGKAQLYYNEKNKKKYFLHKNTIGVWEVRYYPEPGKERIILQLGTDEEDAIEIVNIFNHE